MARPAISDDQRRARAVVRHHLGRTGAGTIADVVRDVVALHATDPATVLLSVWARLPGFAVDDFEVANYDDRSVVRLVAMRRTVWVVPTEAVPAFDAGAGAAVAAAERRKLERLVAEQVPGVDPAAWLGAIADDVLAHLDRVGEAAASELTKAVPGLATKFTLSAGKPYEGTVGLSSRLLFQLAAEGRLIRGRPLGSWLSTQYRWSRTEAWLGGPIERMEAAAGRTELARRWLAAFGPATADDVMWWMGWTRGHTTAALAEVGPVEVDLDDGSVGLVLAGDEDAVDAPTPSVALLPCLDPTAMGWKQRAWQYGAHVSRLFDRNGNVGPSIWWDGRVVGAWAHAPDGTVRTELLEDVGAEATTAVETEAARLATWLGDVRVVARFPGPITKELLAR